MPTILQAFEGALMADAAYVNFTSVPLTDGDLIDALHENGNGRFTLAQAEYFASRFELVEFANVPGSGGLFEVGAAFQGAVFRDRTNPGEITVAFRGTSSIWDALVSDALLTFVGTALGQAGDAENLAISAVQPGTTVNVVGHSLGGHLVQHVVATLPGISFGEAMTFNGAGIGAGVIGAADLFALLRTGETLTNIGDRASLITNYISDASFSVVPSVLTGRRPGTDELVFIEQQIIAPLDHPVALQVDSLFVQSVFEQIVGEGNIDFGTMNDILAASSNDRDQDLESALNTLRSVLGISGSNAVNRESLHRLADTLLTELAQNPAPGNLISLLGEEPDTVQQAALQDTPLGLAYRAALVNGMSFVVDGPDYAAFNQSGELKLSEFTPEYLRDRSTYLNALLESNARNSEFYGSDLTDVVDLESIVFEDDGTELLFSPGIGSIVPKEQLRQIRFGGSGNDTLVGGESDDRLYGGQDDGNDTLIGNSGNDYLEGGDGDDILRAGRGTNDVADGGAGDDTYFFANGDQTLTIRDSDGSGKILIEGISPSPVQLGLTTIALVNGSTRIYEDANGFTYESSSFTNELFINTPNGELIIVEDFTNGNLGITLTDGVPDQAPSPTGDEIGYDVDISLGTANPAFFVDDPTIWFNGPAWFSDTAFNGELAGNVASEVINTVAAPYGHAVFGGYGDSFLTGDDGHNALYDDTYLNPSTGITFWDPSPFTSIVGDDVLRGEGGDDDLISHSGDDWLFGGTGNDLLADVADASNEPANWVNPSLQTSNDHLFGEDGDDYLVSHRGDDILDGGAGDDDIYGGADDDQLVGGAGNDILSGDTRLSSIGPGPNAPGSAGAQILNLTGETQEFGDDVLDGGAGADTMFGGGGNDVLSGGDGADRLQGDFLFGYSDLRVQLQNHNSDPGSIHGNDVLTGNDGNDILYGGGGDDTLRGGADDDTLFGDYDENNPAYSLDSAFHGDDILGGGSGNDVAFGNGGDDRLSGGDGNDSLFGGAGNDSLIGGEGIDQLVGGAGADFLDGGTEADTLFGDAGNDELFGGAGDDQLVGGDDNDVLRGEAGSDNLFGGDGDDRLFGGTGQDTLQGGAGDDILTSGPGGDSLFGEAGEDTYVLNAGDGQLQIVDSEGASTIRFGAGVSVVDLRLVFANGLVFLDFGSADSIAMDNATFQGIQSVEFADGSSINPAELRQQFRPGDLSFPDRDLITETGVSVSDIAVDTVNDNLILSYSGAVGNWIDTTGLTAKGILVVEGVGTDFGLNDTNPAISLVNWFQAEHVTYVTSVSDQSGGTIAFPAHNQFSRNLIGSDGSEILTGDDQGDLLLGAGGADLLMGGAGNDEYDAGSGPDVMVDASGDDTYSVVLDGSIDVIQDLGGSSDVVRFGTGIAPSDLVITEDVSGLVVQIGAEENGDVLLITDWASDASKVESLEFDDGTVWDLATIDSNISGNRSPDVNGSIADQEISFGTEFTIVIPESTFVDPEDGTQLEYSVIVNGTPILPEWMSFDPQSRTLTGTSTETAAATFTVEVTARDSGGLLNSISFDLIQGATLVGTENDETLVGGDGNDFIFGLGGRDTLLGRAGNDTLDGGEGNDTLHGESGDDTYIGGPGNDEFRAASGNETYVIELGDGGDVHLDQGADSHTFRFGAGIDPQHVVAGFGVGVSSFTWETLRIRYNPVDSGDYVELFSALNRNSENHLFEFSGGQVLSLQDMFDLAAQPTDGDDTLHALEPGASVSGRYGRDRLLSSYTPGEGGAGVTLAGDQGHDVIVGGDGNDVLLGGSGNDDIEDREDGNDVIDGGDGNDQIEARGGNNQIFGGAGDDLIRLTGGNGSGTVIGGTGNDQITFSTDDYRFVFSAGDGYDTISVSNGTSPIVEFGSGIEVEDLVFERFEDDLSVKYGTGDQIYFPNWFDAGSTRTVRFVGSSGAETPAADIPEIQALADGDPANFSPSRDLSEAPDDIDVSEGSPFSLTLSPNIFSDPDGDPLVLNATNNGFAGLDSWLTFDPDTGTFSGTPPNGAPNRSILVTASDPAGASASISFSINVANVNEAPQVEVILPDVDATVDEQLVLRLSQAAFIDDDVVNEGSTPEYDQLSYSAQLSNGEPLPAWLTFDPIGFALAGRPPAGSEGALSIEVTATDLGGLRSSQVFTISVGNGGANTIIGTPGDDVLIGGADNDQIFGRAGNDEIRGNEGDDMLFGEEGDDLLVGGAGADELSGGAGNDRLRGNEGDDTLFGEDGDDLLIGGAGADELSGGAGADELRGRSGADVISGGADDDLLFGNGGADVLFGDEGNDTIDGGGGADDIFAGSGDDIVTGGNGRDEVHGEDGDDTIDGEDGNDRLFGDAGMDTLQGGLGNDLLEGGLDDDILSGGAGNDRLRGNEGDDTLFGEDGDDLLIGGAGADELSGGAGADELRGRAGADVIAGGADDDLVFGNGGADTLFGNEGNDIIDGGRGRDFSAGNNGADIYVFNLGDGRDSIDNFSADAETDTLQIGPTVLAEQLSFERLGDDLRISIDGASDAVLVQNWFADSTQEIDFVETVSDGVVVTAAEINAMLGSAVGLSTKPTPMQFARGSFGRSLNRQEFSIESVALVADPGRRRYDHPAFDIGAGAAFGSDALIDPLQNSLDSTIGYRNELAIDGCQLGNCDLDQLAIRFIDRIASIGADADSVINHADDPMRLEYDVPRLAASLDIFASR